MPETVLLLILGITFSASGALAQVFGHGEETSNPAVNPPLFESLDYRNIGPYRGGRSVAVAGHKDQPHTFYQSTTGGGVLKTTDGGNSWIHISDEAFKTGSVGCPDRGPF